MVVCVLFNINSFVNYLLVSFCFTPAAQTRVCMVCYVGPVAAALFVGDFAETLLLCSGIE